MYKGCHCKRLLFLEIISEAKKREISYKEFNFKIDPYDGKK